MKEIRDIVAAFDEAQTRGERSLLATVVAVEGSSYRRPGARMLVTESGRLTGAISGGCLEGDALQKALHAMALGESRLAVYDTTDEADGGLGLRLGCNGIVSILFEPLIGAESPLPLLRTAITARRDAALATLYAPSRAGPHPGTCLLRAADTCLETPAAHVFPSLAADAERSWTEGKKLHLRYPNEAGTVDAVIDHLRPPVSLVIAGAGNDVQPLCRLAHALGWETTVIDARPSHAATARFPGSRLVAAEPAGGLARVSCDAYTAFVAMTHSFTLDAAFLAAASRCAGFYCGLLGPREKLARLVKDPAIAGDTRLHGPTGLDTGAETSEEIALSITAEIAAVLAGRSGGKLRDTGVPIHPRGAA